MVATDSGREHTQSSFGISNEFDIVDNLKKGIAENSPDSLEGGRTIEIGSKEVGPQRR